MCQCAPTNALRTEHMQYFCHQSANQNATYTPREAGDTLQGNCNNRRDRSEPTEEMGNLTGWEHGTQTRDLSPLSQYGRHILLTPSMTLK